MYQLKSCDIFKSTDAIISMEERAPQDDYPEHSHDFHELVIVRHGVGQHIINDIPTNLARNYICYVSPKDRHLYEQSDNLHLTNILFKKNCLTYSPLLKQVLPREDNDPSAWYISTESMHKVQQLITQMNTEVSQPSVEGRLMLEALFQQLVVELSRGRLDCSNAGAGENNILHIIDWIQNHYAAEINVKATAERFNVSSRTLSRRIKEMTNLSFNNYVHRVRINKAINLLQYSELSITDIAFQVGYKDSNYFSTKFKRFAKRTPSEFR